MLVSVYSMVRIMIFMAQDGLMPKIFTHISQTTQTPIYNTVIIGMILALLAGSLPLDILGDVVEPSFERFIWRLYHESSDFYIYVDTKASHAANDN